MVRGTKKAYVRFADVYDQVMSGVPYDQWFMYIRSVWEHFGHRPERVLDLACGTGNMAAEMAKAGYQLVGVDASPDMLEAARRKFASQGLQGEFVQGDMREFGLETPVDGAVCVFDSLNYLLEPEDLKAAFASISRSLRDGGLFVFDVNTPMRLAIIPRATQVIEGPDYYLVWSDYYDRARNWWRVNLTGFIRDAGRWQRFDEVHRERAFPVESLAEWLSAAGFEVLGVFDGCSFEPAMETTSRAYFVARKICSAK